MPDADAALETTESDEAAVHTPAAELDEARAESDAEPESFDRPYVEKLRKESAGYRDRAKTAEARADALARALFTARVAATGRLADATDLAFDVEALDDAEKLSTAIDSLLNGKPHLKSRKPTGSVGQGVKGENTDEFSLLRQLGANV
ncbi:hypothetical protein [Mycobacterium simiae]|uniref:hypothetical protein n=1 Tax=Mycobacterium simiae TaxID=1784 RepID=UPI00040CE906|nr:hypothetical protein [Mycobacterium simiae]PLV48209.1 hypothetical protein X011_17630 [Mycobacterium tuberculosis variant microti OV254]BBX39811.1 hypothetical protein MSIM_12620 [Mycobacterium simiae]